MVKTPVLQNVLAKQGRSSAPTLIINGTDIHQIPSSLLFQPTKEAFT
jgi:hypothetical protein